MRGFRSAMRNWTVVVHTLSWILALCFSVSVSQVAAATFQVNDGGDEIDANNGDGVCETAGVPPKCTIRAAVQESNTLSGPDMIVIPAGKFLLTRGCIIFKDAVTVSGAGMDKTILDGNDNDGIFESIAPGKVVSVSNMTLFRGAQAHRGGGIANRGSALTTVESCRIIGNSAPLGGGVYNDVGTTMKIISSEIRDNLSTASVGGGQGGGVVNFGWLTIMDSTISHNRSIAAGTDEAWGGGVHSRGGRLTILRSTISDNLAYSPGGSAYGGGVSATGTTAFAITGATIKDNAAKSTTSDALAEVQGGGIYVRDVPNGSIKGTAISGNSVYSLLNSVSARGGGIAVVQPVAASVITLAEQSSIVDNRTNGPRYGGLFRQTPSSLVLSPGTVVRGNLPK